MLASALVLSLLSLLVATEPDYSARPADPVAKDAGQPSHPGLPGTDRDRGRCSRQRAA